MAAPVPVPRPTTGAAVRPIATPKPSKLNAVTTGVLDEAKRFFLYGTRGVGKSTLAADCPGAIFLDIDQGTGHLPVTRYPIGSDPTYLDVIDAIDDLTNNPHPQPYKALVIDEAAKLESLMWEYLVSIAPVDKDGVKPQNIEEIGGGFQKGYVVAELEWRALMKRLDTLRVKRGLHIIILGHATTAKEKNVKGEDYHKHAPQLHPKAAGVVGGGCDVVGFVTFDDIAKRAGRKSIGVTGTRVILLEHSATSDAKARLPLPPMIEMDESSPWAPFAEALESLRSMSPTTLRAAIEVELTRLGPTFTRENGTTAHANKVRASIAKAGDNTADLHRFLTILQQSNPITTESTEETP